MIKETDRQLIIASLEEKISMMIISKSRAPSNASPNYDRVIRRLQACYEHFVGRPYIFPIHINAPDSTIPPYDEDGEIIK